jgi:hypothetical protein
MEVKKLPARPSLEQYKKQAKELVKAFESNQAEVLQRIKAAHERFRKLRDSEIHHATFALADAQFVVAREHGFESWPKFAKHVTSLARTNSSVAQFEAAVDAIVTGDIGTLKRLLRQNPELIGERSNREHRAMLLHYVGANGVENFRQKTPRNAVEVAEVLLGAGAEVDAMADLYGGSTTLGLVVTSVFPFLAGVQDALADTFLKHGADIDHPRGAGNQQCPVNGCLANGRPEAAEFLARRGARLDLEAAGGVGRLEVVKAFFDTNGALKDNATEAQMRSAFKWACQYGRTAVVEFLLQRGLDASEIHRGECALHCAAYGGHADIIRLLLKGRPPVDVKDKTFDATPLGWGLHGWNESAPGLKREGYYEVVTLLVAAGATVYPKWLGEGEGGSPIARKILDDPRMLAALNHLV